MKITAKPIVALALGAALLLGMSLSAQAQPIVFGEEYEAFLAAHNDQSSDELAVQYSVDDSDGVYTYNYTLSNPSVSGALLESFNVSFDATQPGSAFDISAGGGSSGGAGVTWSLSVPAGSSSSTLSFESDDAPTLGNANSIGGNTAGHSSAPWASVPNGEQVAVPQTAVPEPAITSLLAMGLPLLGLRARFFKKMRLNNS